MVGWLSILARLVVGGVWIVAGVLKLPDPAASVRAVRAYDILPESLVPLVGHGLPILEIVVGACLVLGVLLRASAVVSTVMLALFIVGIASVWARGIQIECGCFGGGGTKADAMKDYPWEIARDVALLLASLLVVWKGRTALALDNLLFPYHEGRFD